MEQQFPYPLGGPHHMGECYEMPTEGYRWQTVNLDGGMAVRALVHRTEDGSRFVPALSDWASGGGGQFALAWAAARTPTEPVSRPQ